jgi:hypothetical protein
MVPHVRVRLLDDNLGRRTLNQPGMSPVVELSQVSPTEGRTWGTSTSVSNDDSKLRADLFQFRAHRNILEESSQHGLPFIAQRGGDDHAIRFQPTQLARRQVGHDDHLPSD